MSFCVYLINFSRRILKIYTLLSALAYLRQMKSSFLQVYLNVAQVHLIMNLVLLLNPEYHLCQYQCSGIFINFDNFDKIKLQNMKNLPLRLSKTLQRGPCESRISYTSPMHHDTASYSYRSISPIN